MPAKDCTITITSVPKVYHITYEGKHLTRESLKKTAFTIDDLPLKLQRANCNFPYTFRGWLDENGNPVKTIMKPANVTVYADTADVTFLIWIILALIAASFVIMFLLLRDEIKKKKAGIPGNHAKDTNSLADDKPADASDSANASEPKVESHTDMASEKLPEETSEEKSEAKKTEAELTEEPKEAEKMEKSEDRKKTENPEKTENNPKAKSEDVKS